MATLEPHTPYPGHVAWAKLAGLYLNEGDPGDGDFVHVQNPTEQKLRALIFIGVEPRLQRRLEALRPPGDRMTDREITSRLEQRTSPLYLRAEYIRIGLTWDPGEAHWIPRTWWPALRQVGDSSLGRVVLSGLCPQLIEVGEVDPPELHPALRPDVVDLPKVGGRRRA